MWEPNVESVMTKKVITAQPNTTFKDLVALMSEHEVSGLPVVDLMTAPAITIGTDATVTAAARVLAEKNIRRLCVVDDDGVLVGVVSRRDVIGTFLRDDAVIRADIEEYVFKKGMWLFPGSLNVEVIDGVATLDGSVERRTTAQVAGQLTHSVPGVVAVRDNLTYELDDTVTSPL